MLKIRWAWFVLMILTGLFGVTACDNLSRGEPALPQSVVDAIAGESVKMYAAFAPEGAILIEDARLVTYWGEVPSEETADYSEVICFQSEVKYFDRGVEWKLYYQGMVKKPVESGEPWFVDEVPEATWYQYGCSGGYLRRSDADGQATETAEGK